MNLYEMTKGKSAEIVGFEDNITKCDSLRFGLAIGQKVSFKSKLGPIVVCNNNQTIAIGKNLSKKIKIKEI